MLYTDRREQELKKKIIPQNAKPDFESFWKQAVTELRKVPLSFTKEIVSLPYKTFETYEIIFNTHDDTKVKAYFSVPVQRDHPLPCVVKFHGGGGNRTIDPAILATGVCCFAMDVRSQGGTTFDLAHYEMGNDYVGALMTHDLLCKDTFYMKNIYLDAIRAVDVVASLPEVDPNRIVTTGESQGGALSIVAAALSGKVRKAYPTVPSYGCLERRVEAGSGVFGAVNKFLLKHPEHTDAAFDTLSYFDINNLVSLLKVPSSFCLGLADPICIPEFVYSMYHHTAGPKELYMYPFTPHTISYEHHLRILTEFSKL